MWIDTHCHLEMLDADLEEIVLKSKEQGVTQIITIGTDKPSNRFVFEMTQKFDNIYGALGFHPHDAQDFNTTELQWNNESTKKNKKIVAVGECGLDYYYENSPKKVQKEAFEIQLESAITLDKPIVIHTREADKDTEDIMKPFLKRGLRGVLHSFTSSWELAKFNLDYGFYVSFNGICTFKNAEDVRDIVKKVPLEQMLVETDSPFLTPIPHRGKKNYPGFVKHTGEFIANLLNLNVEDFAKTTSINAKKLFNI